MSNTAWYQFIKQLSYPLRPVHCVVMSSGQTSLSRTLLPSMESPSSSSVSDQITDDLPQSL